METRNDSVAEHGDQRQIFEGDKRHSTVLEKADILYQLTRPRMNNEYRGIHGCDH